MAKEEDGDDNTDQNQNTDSGKIPDYDPTQHGPIKNRSCTDIICCLLFIICILGYLALGGWAYVFGDPYKLIYPSDDAGNVCGKGDYANKTNVFFFDLLVCAAAGAKVVTTGCPTAQICVESCPSESWTYVMEAATLNDVPDADLQKKLYCKYSTEFTTKTLQELVSDGDCAAYYLEETSYFGRCLPSALSSLAETLTSTDGTSITDSLGNIVNGTALSDSTWITTILNAATYAEYAYDDMVTSWRIMAVIIAFGTILTFLWIVLMRWIAGPIIWMTLVSSLGILSYTSYYTVMKLINWTGNTTSITDIQITTDVSYWSNLYYTWVVLASLSCLGLLIILIILVFLRNRIKIAVALIGIASKAVGAMMFTLIWPLWPLLLQLICLIHWLITALFIASVVEPVYGSSEMTSKTTTIDGVDYSEYVVNALDSVCDSINGSTSDQICTFIKYGGQQYATYMQVYALFMFLWCMNFFIAFGQIVLAGAFASYYWAFDKSKDVPTFPLLSSIGRALRYHIGTIAFGSFIIAVIQLARIALEYIDRKCKDQQNALTSFIIKCLKCCMWCFEKCMKFLNKNAYILCAVYGKNFCVSAKNAFFLLIRNAVRVVVVDKVTDFLILLGQLVITAVAGLLAFAAFTNEITTLVNQADFTTWMNKYTSLTYFFVPIIIICIVVFLISVVFFNVYSMAVDTVFMCFLEDLERHDGSAENPYFMPSGLMGIVGVKNVKEGKTKSKCC